MSIERLTHSETVFNVGSRRLNVAAVPGTISHLTLHEREVLLKCRPALEKGIDLY